MSHDRLSIQLVVFAALLLCVTCVAAAARRNVTPQGFENFVRCDGDVLMDGERPF